MITHLEARERSNSRSTADNHSDPATANGPLSVWQAKAKSKMSKKWTSPDCRGRARGYRESEGNLPRLRLYSYQQSLKQILRRANSGSACNPQTLQSARACKDQRPRQSRRSQRRRVGPGRRSGFGEFQGERNGVEISLESSRIVGFRLAVQQIKRATNTF